MSFMHMVKWSPALQAYSETYTVKTHLCVQCFSLWSLRRWTSRVFYSESWQWSRQNGLCSTFLHCHCKRIPGTSRLRKRGGGCLHYTTQGYGSSWHRRQNSKSRQQLVTLAVGSYWSPWEQAATGGTQSTVREQSDGCLWSACFSFWLNSESQPMDGTAHTGVGFPHFT